MMRAMTRWQWLTLFSLTVGYAGYYFCRSNFSVATPLLIEQFGDQGLDKTRIGLIASTAVFFYAGGKLFNGILCDFVGGRRMFLFGMFASVLATIAFGFGTGFAVFMFAWCANRFVQSMGWGALIKTASAWFPPQLMGSLTGILCLSYLFGDVIAKLVLGSLIEGGMGWRGVFFSAAAVLGTIFVVANFTLKSKPEDVGEASPPVRQDNLFGDEGGGHRPQDLFELLIPFIQSPAFWLVSIMNFGLTLVRETFNFWTPTYLNEVIGMTSGAAAQASSLFPFFGGLSVLAAGWLSDRVGNGRRGGVMLAFLLPAVIAVFVLAAAGQTVSQMNALILISLVGFLIMGPYAFLSGVIAVDLGARRGSSTAAGIADSVGYLGGIVSGGVVGAIAQQRGWSAAFAMLGGVLIATLVVCVFYYFAHERRHDITTTNYTSEETDPFAE